MIHSFAGVSLVLNRYHSTEDAYASVTAEIIAYAVGAHHGLFDVFNDVHECGFEHRLHKQSDYDLNAIKNFHKECCNERKLDALFSQAKNEIEVFFTKIKHLTETEGANIDFYIGFLARLIVSAVIHADRTDTADFMLPGTEQPDFIAWDSLLKQVESRLFSMGTKTPIQKARRELSDLCSYFAEQANGIYRLNLPTGAGKTLSSLRYALKHSDIYRKKRIIYIAPLITILEQNAEVWKSFLGQNIVLEHHSDVVQVFASEKEEAEYEYLIQSWDAQVIVTTLVQFLQTLFSGQTSCIRRLQSLSDSVIILDEVQSVPAKLLNLFNLALNFLSTVCNSTILLCSATQPCLEQTECPLLISEPQFLTKKQSVYYSAVFKRNNLIPIGEKTISDLVVFAKELLTEINSVLLVCNKKSEAAQLFDLLECGRDIHVFHLSASMCTAHRSTVLRNINESLQKNERVICVSTQVIEAGVDISFGSVIRLCAGMDSIVQAAGRCNRNGESEKIAPVYIVNLIGENLNSLKEIRDAKNATLALLSEYERNQLKFGCNPASDQAIDFYYRYLYKNMKAEYRNYAIEQYPTLLSMLSENERYAATSEYSERYFLRQAFKTAGKLFRVFDENTVSVLVPYQDGENLISELCTLNPEWDYVRIHEIMPQLKKYCVTVFDSAFDILLKNQSVRSVCKGLFYVLMPDCYDENKGFLFNQQRSDINCNILIL